jgi:hypothetical protein
MAAQQAAATGWSTPVSPPAPPETALPDGWSIVDYPGKLGKSSYAVFANGRRLASGMTSVQSATRWARLLVATQSWRDA